MTVIIVVILGNRRGNYPRLESWRAAKRSIGNAAADPFPSASVAIIDSIVRKHTGVPSTVRTSKID